MLKLYLDEDVPTELAAQLRLRGIDAITTQEAGMSQTPDEEQLAFAAEHERVLVTYDRDFSGIATKWFRAGKEHKGIIVSRERGTDELGDLISMCSRLALTTADGELANLILPLELFR